MLSSAQVLLRWQIQELEAIAVLPKSSNPGRIEENCNLKRELTDEEMNNLNSLNCNNTRGTLSLNHLRNTNTIPLNRLNYEYIQATGNKASYTAFLN